MWPGAEALVEYYEREGAEISNRIFWLEDHHQ